MNLKMEVNCVVCMEIFEDSNQIKIFHCKHFLHDTCTAGWLAVSIY